MLNVKGAIRWGCALGVGAHKVSDYVKLAASTSLIKSKDASINIVRSHSMSI